MNTCEAHVGKTVGAFGWEPVQCRQTVGLASLLDAAGITHHACSRWGHRQQLVRRFGETILPEETCHRGHPLVMSEYGIPYGCSECLDGHPEKWVGAPA